MIILVGASASGKSVVVKKMNELYGIEKVVTYTTRPMRAGEINDVDYHFIDKDDFVSKKENNFFLETAFYNNNYYGTAFEDIPDDWVCPLCKTGKENALLSKSLSGYSLPYGYLKSCRENNS